MRTIDLICKLCSPIVAGVVLQFDLVYPRPVFTAVFIGLWNFLSFFGELGLLVVVYRMIPTLARKKLRTSEMSKEEDENKEEEVLQEEEEEEEGRGGRLDGGSKGIGDDGNDKLAQEGNTHSKGTPSDTQQGGGGGGGEGESGDEAKVNGGVRGQACHHCLGVWLSKLLSPLVTIRDGWRVFIRQDVARVGFSMASLYLTVLGLNGITATYFLTQGVPEYAIGVIQGIGGFVGILGSMFYPWIRGRIGTVRTGLVGTGSQLSMLLFCVAAVFSPGISLSGGTEDYYSAKCSIDNSGNASLLLLPASSVLLATPSSLYATPSFLYAPPSSLYATPSFPYATPIPISSLPFTPSTDVLSVVPASTILPMPTSTATTTFVEPSSAPPSFSPTPSGKPNPSSMGTPSVSIAVVLMALGVVLARFGLWMYDLVVSQLVQETVREEQRGVVSGVMNAMNSIMDMLQYVLVLGVPSPAHFGYLTLVSVSMVTVGFLLYLSYARKVRGHLLHLDKCRKWCGGIGGGRKVAVETGHHPEALSIINRGGDDEEEENEKL